MMRFCPYCGAYLLNELPYNASSFLVAVNCPTYMKVKQDTDAQLALYERFRANHNLTAEEVETAS